MNVTAERRRRIAGKFHELKIDAALISGLPNIRYLAGFTGSNASLLVLADGEGILFTDPRYTIRASQESDCKVVIAKTALQVTALKTIARRRIRRVGLEPGRLLMSAWLELHKSEGANLSFVPMPAVVEALRMVKSDQEIAAIRASVLTNSKAFDRALKRVRPSTTEAELAAEIEFQQRKLGAEGFAFESIVAAGANSALPHAVPTAEPVGTGRLLLIDIGALQSGYCSDMTRVVHLGKPGAKARRLYKAVLEAQLAAIDVVRPGITAAAVDRAARKVLDRYGMGELFVHSTGHGLGLEIHEGPRLGRKDKTRLEAGMAITIEPGAYVEGFGGVRIEDTVLVTPGGCEILTPTPKEFLVL